MLPLSNQGDIIRMMFGDKQPEEIPPSLLLPIRVNLIVTDANSKPALQLRRTLNDNLQIKALTMCAIHKLPCVIYPTFSDQMQSMAQLIKKGIIYQENGNYFFNF